MSDGFVGIGVKLLTDVVLADTFVEVPEVNTLPDFSQDAAEVDFTHLNSPGGVKEYKTGLKDGASSSIEINWIPSNAQHTALRTAASVTGGTVVKVQIQWPDDGNTQVQVPMLVKNFKVNTPIGDKVTATIDVKVSGPATWGTWV